MRRTGFVDTVGGLDTHDHVCWVFDSRDQYRSAAGQFLADGLAGGQRVVFVGPSVRDTDLDSVAGFAAARATGGARVQDVGVYDPDIRDDPARQVEVWAREADRALADGYTGLRVAADVTPLVATAESRAAFGRYEFLIDAHMARHPLTGMCGFDRSVLSADTIADLACMHPLAPRSATTLLVSAGTRPGIAATLAGEVDFAEYGRLRTALSRIPLTPADGAVTLDARGLSFIDHRGLIELVGQIRNRGARTDLLVGPRSVVHTLADLLRLPDLRVVVS